MVLNSYKKKLVTLIAILIIVSTVLPTINAKTLNLKSPRIVNNLKTKNFSEKNPELPENYRNIEFKPGEIIIKFKENSKVSLTTNDNSINSGLKTIDELNKKFNVKSFTKISIGKNNDFQPNLYKLILNENNDIFSTITEYNSNPNVEYAEPNYIYHTCNIPNDIFFDEQWALHNNGQYGGTPDADIDAIEAWNIEKGNSNVTIAILDSGIDYNHPDLVKNIWLNEKEISDNDVDDDNNGFVDDICGWDFANNDNDPADDYGHGTHCAGIAGAVTNNNLGIAGICWNCKIMPIKIGSYSISSDAAANGIKYAADNGADVISMSWGGGGESQTIKDALDYAYTKGVVLISSSGNSNINLDTYPISFYPAEYDNVISVAATDFNDEIADFSNYGLIVDVAAPGVNILSTLPTYNVTLNEAGFDKYYSNMSGTSMACPYVSGLVGLILSKQPDLTPSNIRTILNSGVDVIDTEKNIGFGRINAYSALQKTADVRADITNPSTNAELKGIVDIKGTATGKKFEGYTLEYGRGISPNEWTLINSSDKSVENSLVGLWDTTKVDECLYTLKLTVVNNGISYEDKVWVMVNNIHNTIFVDDDNDEGPWAGTAEHPCKNIQNAINLAGSGDTVYVFSGNYREDILIYTPVVLLGEDKYTTIINADISSCVTIFVEKVKISGFSLIGRSHSVLIYSNNNTIEGNIITPILPHFDASGIQIEPFIFGIGRLSSGEIVAITPNIKGNILSNNEIIKNNIGISFNEASENCIFHNNFKENLAHATFVFSSISIKDIVFQNSFKYKSKSFKNSWDNNYWDDWIGIKYNKCKIFPKAIQGTLLVDKLFFTNSTIFRNTRMVKWLNFDRDPLSEPWEDWQ